MSASGLPSDPSSRAPHSAWPVARLFGVEIHLHWSMGLLPLAFLLALGSELPELSASLVATGVLSLLATLVILSHGLAHLWASGALSGASHALVLTPLSPLFHGSHATRTSRDAIHGALAGPATHAAWTLLGYAVYELLPPSSHAANLTAAFVLANAALGALNLLPFHPLDGGRLLQAVLGRYVGAQRAEVWTASAGYGGAVALALAGFTLLLGTGESGPYVPWALLLIVVGAATLTASQQQLFAAQLRAHVRELEPRATRRPARAPDFLDEAELASAPAAPTPPAAAPAAPVVESEEQRRRRLQERIDALLDRINEVGGVDGLTDEERSELSEASQLLRRETARG